MASTQQSHRPTDRTQALKLANEIRRARARLKRRIAAGDLSADQVILAPPREARSWPLIKLLISQPRWGKVRCRRFLLQAEIDERKPIGDLTERQRRLLVAQLGARGSRQR
jgi:hypothetical protein